MFGAFGKILLSSEILGSGNQYVFTFTSGEWFFLHSTDTIRVDLADRMANLGQIMSVTRSLFSDRYVVTVLSTSNVSLADWLSAFDVSWRDMGWDSIVFDMAEEGMISSQPGGVSELIPDIGGTVGRTAGEIAAGAIKPLFPYILIGLAIYVMLPQLIHGRGRA